MASVDEQIDLIVILLAGNPWGDPGTPIYDDIAAAHAAGFQGEYHPHWELEMRWAADAERERECGLDWERHEQNDPYYW